MYDELNPKGKVLIDIDQKLLEFLFNNEQNKGNPNFSKPREDNSNETNWTKIGVFVAIILGVPAIIGVAITAIVYWQQICDFLCPPTTQ